MITPAIRIQKVYGSIESFWRNKKIVQVTNLLSSVKLKLVSLLCVTRDLSGEKHWPARAWWEASSTRVIQLRLHACRDSYKRIDIWHQQLFSCKAITEVTQRTKGDLCRARNTSDLKRLPLEKTKRHVEKNDSWATLESLQFSSSFPSRQLFFLRLY